jgi:glutaredoxin
MADKTRQPLIFYGTAWCSDCRRSKRFLDEHHILYDYIDIEQDTNAMTRVMELNHGMRSVPTIIFPDGSILVEPSNSELARKLGIQ